MSKIIKDAPFQICKDTDGKACIGLFRDDGLALVKGITEADITWINNWFDDLFPNFSFEIKIAKSIEFLDITISITNETIVTAPYSKPSCTHKYVPPQSGHDRMVISAIPYSVFYRLKLISSTKNIFEEAAKEYWNYLLKSGYDENLLQKKLDEIRMLNRKMMLVDKEKASNKNLVAALVLDSHPGLNHIRQAWRQSRDILKLDPLVNNMWSGNRNIVLAYRRGEYCQRS